MSNEDQPSILKFHAAESLPLSCSRLSHWRSRLREYFGRILNRLGFPGAIADAEIEDGLTGTVIKIHSCPYFTCLTVNGRDFYFRRLSGKFDGTGSGCC